MMNFNNGAYYGNGMPPAYQRLLETQQYQQQYQQPQILQNNQPSINSSFVTNIHEAQAQPVGFNATNIAIDNTNNKIYLKRMDNNGVAITKTYVQQEDTSTQIESSSVPSGTEILKEEIESVKNEVSSLRENFDKGFLNLSVEIENIVNNLLEAHLKKLKGDKNAQK